MLLARASCPSNDDKEFHNYDDSVEHNNSITLQLHSADGSVIATACIPKFMFIAYDVLRIHQILTLNFFEFLDELSDETHPIPGTSPYIIKYYDKIARLNDPGMLTFLEDLGKKN